MKELESNTVESSELVEQTFKFWLTDNNHLRSPFPSYIHAQLRHQATNIFWGWVKNLNSKAKEEINDTIVGEKFEEIIFETALNLIQTEDERITILYPFLPRKGDLLEGNKDKIIFRALEKEGDHSFMKIILKNKETQKEWETKFELPV